MGVVSATADAAAAPGAPSRWRPTPARLLRHLAGLCLFGTGEALLVNSELGNSPWTVLAQGVARQAGIAVGTATIAISFAILVAWIPLRQRLGLGTILNALVIGLAINAVLAAVDTPAGLLARWLDVLAGILLVAAGSGLYLTSFLGPGPRDGLMTGLHRRTGVAIPAVRVALELGVLTAGWALGGTLGLGTLAFALAIGPAVGVALSLMARGPLTHL
jgi:uncharacterized membrane protein YczE